MATHYGQMPVTLYLPFVSEPNYVNYPLEINTNIHGTLSFFSEDGWCLGPNALYVGTTTAPDNSQNAVIYKSIVDDGDNCFVSQGWESKWAVNRTITISVWARLIDDAGKPLSNVMNIARNQQSDRISVGTGEIKNYWKKFSTTFQCGNSKEFYQAIFLFEAWKTDQQVALWGASLTY
jgi:hypothetical protein